MQRPSRTTSAVGLVLGLAVATLAGVAVCIPPAAAATVKLNPKGSVQVVYRGNGHGHGLSQYGAYGAALAGRSYSQILVSYYHGTKLTTISPTRIRVHLSGTGTSTTVQAYRGITVYGMSGYLPVDGVRRYRLVADSGTGLTLQKLPWKSTSWVTVRTGLPDASWFRRTIGQGLRLIQPDGTSTFYYDYLRAYRAAARGAAGGVSTVNVTSLEHYTAGVTPREMPSSWSAAAVNAQAVAARTYGYYYVQHPMNPHYDICDTSWCQVFGGHLRYDGSAQAQWSDYPPAAQATADQVLTYQGSVVFAQYSASDGGWTTDGGQPYLRAAADPYDPGRSGDPYVNARESVKVSVLAKYVGLSTVTGLSITKRDGHGAWGGRVLSAVVSGTRGSQPATRTVSGYDLQSAFGLGTTWLDVAAA